MERHAFAMKVKDGQMNTYRRKLGEIWPELTGFLDRNQIKNFSIWNVEQLIFGYYEKADGAVLNAEEKSVRDRLTGEIQDTFQWISTPGEDMRLMYHNFGVVRESKELIRHRVFITKLRPGKEEDYKRAHDGLAAARQGKTSPGPDSNFSIWYAGGYIFGYDEIDVTMEHEPTEAERQASIAWETRMLELMSWVTDDIDWMLNERHAHIVRLAFHN